MKIPHLFALLAVGATPAFGGYVYISDFSGTTLAQPLQTIAEFNAGTPGVDGWKQSESNNDDTSPLSWMTTHAGSPAGAIGTYYDVPVGTIFNVSRAINAPLAGSTLSLDFGIVGSTVDYPDQNGFSITVANASGAGLLTMYFMAIGDQSQTDQWNFSWESSTGQNSGGFVAGVLAGGAYNFTVDFTANGNDVDAAMSVTGLNDWSDTVTLTDLNGETFSDLDIGMDMGLAGDWGDNSFSFRGVPEPGTAMLLLLSGFGLLRRRR